MNHVEGDEFGTVEASLLNSVAAILGIHSGNIELYRQQSELLAGVVRALTSAIDAKDPYTCGHSDRVARVAVRLAQELGCDASTLNTIYLSGLLHDIGKIGIDDSVLRKPGKLTDAEYEHIKRHVEIGHQILRDLKKLDDVLPVVLHHHESWDGAGYPEQACRRAHPALGPHRRRGRLLRRHGQRPSLPQGHARREDRRDLPRRRGQAMGPAGGRGLLPRPRRHPADRPLRPGARQQRA